MYLRRFSQFSICFQVKEGRQKLLSAYPLFHLISVTLLCVDNFCIDDFSCSSCISFILPTHNIGRSVLSCSVTPSLSAICSTNRKRKQAYRLMGTATQTLFTGMQESSLHHATHKWQIEQLSC